MEQPTVHRDKPSILIVDDVPANIDLLVQSLEERDYIARPAANGEQALQAAREDPPDLILLDINMPEMDGYEVCQRLKADDQLAEIPILFISALSETMDKVKAFAVGGVDYITKPFQFEEVHARVEAHLQLRKLQLELQKHSLHLEELVQAKVKEISDSQMATIFALAKLAESRDEDTGQHIERTQTFCRILAEKLRENPRYAASIDQTHIVNIYHAAPLHDIGKVGIPDSILLKPGRLTPEEFETMKAHATIGAQTLQAARSRYPRNAFLNMGIAIARSHHEKWDGSGYPEGLVAEDIPLSARIMALADVYDALRSKRVYKPAFPHEKARQIITEGSNGHFDPSVVEAFVALESEFAAIRERMAEGAV